MASTRSDTHTTRRVSHNRRISAAQPNPLGLSPAAARALRRISEEADEAILEIEMHLFYVAGSRAVDDLRAGAAQNGPTVVQKRHGIAHLLVHREVA